MNRTIQIKVFGTCIIATLLSMSCSLGQNELWPTANAEWYYSYGNFQQNEGVSRVFISHDTTIQGKFCQIYQTQRNVYLTLPPAPSNDADTFEFVLALEDSILLAYREPLVVFDTIFNFKRQIGNTWRYRTPETASCDSSHLYIQTTLLNVSDTVVNGRLLHKYTVQRIKPDSTVYQEQFIQQIGLSTAFFFSEHCQNPIDAPSEYFLRCFNMDIGGPNAFSVMNGNTSCDYYPKVDLLELQFMQYILYPNPTTDFVQLLGLPEHRAARFQFFSIEGKLVKTCVSSNIESSYTFDVSELPKGTYLVKAQIDEKNYESRLVKF